MVRIYCSDLAEEHGSKPLQPLSQEQPCCFQGGSAWDQTKLLQPPPSLPRLLRKGSRLQQQQQGATATPLLLLAAAVAHEPNRACRSGCCCAGAWRQCATCTCRRRQRCGVGCACRPLSRSAGSRLYSLCCGGQAKPSSWQVLLMKHLQDMPLGVPPQSCQHPWQSLRHSQQPLAVPEAQPAPLAVSEAQPAGPQAQARSSSPAASAAPAAAGTSQAVRNVSPVAGREASLGPVTAHLQAAASAGKVAASAIKADPEGVQGAGPDSVPQQVGVSGRSAGGWTLPWRPP